MIFKKLFYIKQAIIHSIKIKITIFALILFCISIWSLSFYATTTLREDMQKILGEQQFTAAKICADQIEEGLKIRLVALEETAKKINQNILNDVGMSQSFLDDQCVLQSLFNATLSIQNSDAIAISGWPKSLEIAGKNYTDRDFVVNPLKQNRSTIGLPVVGKSLQKPSISMGVPIHDESGNVIGVLTGTIALEMTNFLDSVSEAGYGRHGNYFLVSPTQRITITSSKKDRIMVQLSPKGLIPTLDRFLDGYEGSAVYVTQAGIEVLASSKIIPLSDWRIVISMPTKDAFSSISIMQNRIIVITLIITIFIGIFFWKMLTNQFLPIMDAIQTLDVMSKEKQFSEPLSIRRQDEIGHLIKSFNRLLYTLSEQKEQLEDQIQRNNIIQNQLFQASKEAEIGKVVANISHQWRGALAKVGAVNLLTLLQLKNDYPMCKVFLIQQSEEIGRLLDFMSDTMQDFLEFYKPSQQVETFSISNTIQHARNILDKSILDSSLEIIYEVIADKRLSGIKNRWTHIWLNFINNTIDAAKRNGILAPVIKIVLDEDKIVISDNAGGSSIHNTMGIGLMMCSEIVKKHGCRFDFGNYNDGFRIIIIFSK